MASPAEFSPHIGTCMLNEPRMGLSGVSKLNPSLVRSKEAKLTRYNTLRSSLLRLTFCKPTRLRLLPRAL